MTTVNIYLKECDSSRRQPHAHVLRDIGLYLTQLLQLFGIIARGDDAIGFQQAAGQQALEDVILPKLLTFADAREQIRKLALKLKGRVL